MFLMKGNLISRGNCTAAFPVKHMQKDMRLAMAWATGSTCRSSRPPQRTNRAGRRNRKAWRTRISARSIRSSNRSDGRDKASLNAIFPKGVGRDRQPSGPAPVFCPRFSPSRYLKIEPPTVIPRQHHKALKPVHFFGRIPLKWTFRADYGRTAPPGASPHPV